jgi:hypothetical protein
MTGVTVSCRWSSPQISQGNWGSCQEAHFNRPIPIGQDVRLGVGAYSIPTKGHQSSAAVPQKVHCKTGVTGQCVHWGPKLCLGVGAFTSAIGKGLPLKSVLGNRVIQRSREGQTRRNVLHSKRKGTVCALGGSGGQAAVPFEADFQRHTDEQAQVEAGRQAPEPSFDPLSLSKAGREEPAGNESPHDPIQPSLAIQLAAGICLALIVAARQPPSLSNFLCLSLTTASQTGPSPLHSFHPLLYTAWTGLVTGCLHTMTGPDHLASLAPLTIGRSRVHSALLGALWGAGHGSGQLLLGSVFLLFKVRAVTC